MYQPGGYDQLIWTDAREHKYVEESGTMNLMFVIDDVLITPKLGDTILAGIARQRPHTALTGNGVKNARFQLTNYRSKIQKLKRTRSKQYRSAPIGSTEGLRTLYSESFSNGWKMMDDIRK